MGIEFVSIYDISVVSYISSSKGYMGSTISPNIQIIYIAEREIKGSG